MFRFFFLLFLFGQLWLAANFLVFRFIQFLFVFGVLPVMPFIFNAHLQVSVDISLLDLGLSLFDEKAKFLVELVDQVQNI